MEQPVFLSDAGSEGRLAPAPSPNRPAEAATNARITAYLDEVFAPLSDMLPLTRREELRAELATHVEALAEAYHELGSEPDAALQAALAQLGDRRRLGRLWARECRRPASPRPWGGPASPGAALFAGLTLLASGALGASLLVGLEQHLGHNLFELALGGPLLPLAAGALVGFWRGRHPLGSRWGLLLIALAGAGISLLMTAADPRLPLAALIRVLLWLMTACASAGLGALVASGKDILSPQTARL